MTAPSQPRPVPWCADLYAEALRSGRGPLFLRRADGRLLPLDIERWCAPADDADLSVLLRSSGAVLDIGCGPGRLVAELARLGRPTLGIDSSPSAVARTRRLGVDALCRSVFASLPGEGRWDSALLVDGNVGIGGDPGALLARVARLLAPGGLLLAEAAPREIDERCEVRLDDGRGGQGPAFSWARLGPAALRRRAENDGWLTADQWTRDGRPFLALRRSRPPSPGPGDGRSVTIR